MAILPIYRYTYTEITGDTTGEIIELTPKSGVIGHKKRFVWVPLMTAENRPFVVKGCYFPSNISLRQTAVKSRRDTIVTYLRSLLTENWLCKMHVALH